MSGCQKERKFSEEETTSTRTSTTCHIQGPPFNKILPGSSLPLPPTLLLPPSPPRLVLFVFSSLSFPSLQEQFSAEAFRWAKQGRRPWGGGWGGMQWPSTWFGSSCEVRSVSPMEESQSRQTERISQSSVMWADRLAQCPSCSRETRASKQDGSLVKIRRMSM